MRIKYFLSLSLLTSVLISTAFAGASFNIAPDTNYPWPTSVYPGQMVHAYYQVTNQTSSTRSGYQIQGLPSTVTQNTAGESDCPQSISLSPSASCILKLNITGPTQSNFALCHGSNCTSASVPLSIDQASTPISYAYVADAYDIGGNPPYAAGVFQCDLNTDGSFGACAATPSANAPNWQPSSISFATVNSVKYAYVSDSNNVATYQCLVNSDGALSACTLMTGIETPGGAITFASFSGAQYAYIANGENIAQCGLNSEGLFTACETTPSFDSPSWISVMSVAFATVNNNPYAYVVAAIGIFNVKVFRCGVNNQTGDLIGSSCSVISDSSIQFPRSVTFGTVNNTQYAYVADQSQGVFQCSLNSNGSFNTCAVTGPTAYQLSFNTTNNTPYAYVAGQAGVTQCGLNSDGSFESCALTPSENSAWSGYINAVVFSSGN